MALEPGCVAKFQIEKLSSKSSGGWFHPVHVHLTGFFILSRNGATPPPLERGRKDTAVIGGPDFGDVKILLSFPANFRAVPRPVTGRFVFHCHNIEHEDMRMMGQFDVQP